MRIAGVDLGGRKTAISIFADGQLVEVISCEAHEDYSRPVQLGMVAMWTKGVTMGCNHIFVESPLIGRNVQHSLRVAECFGAVLSQLSGEVHPVDNKKWKKEVIGNGNASKEMIREWLKTAHPAYAERCGANQDRIDATAIGLYGVQVVQRSEHLEAL